MSLTLLQGYSSAEEEIENGFCSSEEDVGEGLLSVSNEEVQAASAKKNSSAKSGSNFPYGSLLPSNSSLPSALDAFSEVSGPPDFLSNSVVNFSAESGDSARDSGRGGFSGRKLRRERNLPAGTVVEAKPQLVALRDRVRSDLDGGLASLPAQASGDEGRKVKTAANPEKEDAAELLRMCVKCGVPKTFTHNRGMICPICGDRPPAEPITGRERKGSMIKDKEKSKRMKGQSSHATWKSETEMQLRQQFD
ncbi:plant/protein [Wolffia australiana]